LALLARVLAAATAARAATARFRRARRLSRHMAAAAALEDQHQIPLVVAVQD
jgi:hypothetical protein